jgi:DNA-binding MarR family transcriptional regulator
MKQTALTAELKQNRPFGSAREEAFVGLLRTADALRWRLSEIVEPHGISLVQYNVLRILRGSRETGLPTLEIADRMIEQAPGITRLLDRLEKAGFVRRERVATDRRQVICHIEEKGLKLLSWLDSTMPQATEVLFSSVKPGDLDRLNESLASIRKACAARCPSLKKH